MIDRHSLGMELPPEKVIIAQKWMVMKANVACKPVFALTQIFDSMTIVQDPNQPVDASVKTDDEIRPTRNEA
jgi:pyruvate kinase